MLLFIFFLELFALFLLSRNFSSHFSNFIHQVTKNKHITIYIMAIILFPGTIIHELSHFLMAIILFVPVTNIAFLPRLQNDKLILGQVSVQKTDPIRRLLIGASPVVMGVILIYSFFYFLTTYASLSFFWTIVILCYLSFTVGNTMFSSEKDMEGALELSIFLVLVTIALSFLGFTLPYDKVLVKINELIPNSLFLKIITYLLIPILLDMLLIFFLKIVYKKKNQLIVQKH